MLKRERRPRKKDRYSCRDKDHKSEARKGKSKP